MNDRDREAFEVAVKNILTPNLADLRRLLDGGDYIDTTTSYLCKAWLAALAHRDKQLADLQRQLDELVEAGEFSRIAAASGHYDEAMATFYATLDRIKTTQPKEGSDEV